MTAICIVGRLPPASGGKWSQCEQPTGLLPYGWHFWRTAGRASVPYARANSIWSWNPLIASVISFACTRDRAAINNCLGGKAAAFGVRILDVFPGTRLMIAGTGPEFPRLRALRGKIGLLRGASFIGGVVNSDIPELCASADCLLNSSDGDRTPILTLEAPGSGVPVVSISAGRIPGIVERGTCGLQVPIGEHRTTVRKAPRVLQEAALVEGFRQACVMQAQTRARSHVLSRWLDACRQVLASRRIS